MSITSTGLGKRPKAGGGIEADAWYSADQLARRYGIHVISVWRWARRGILPKPVKIGPNTSRWRGSVILENERRKAATDAD